MKPISESDETANSAILRSQPSSRTARSPPQDAPSSGAIQRRPGISFCSRASRTELSAPLRFLARGRKDVEVSAGAGKTKDLGEVKESSFR